MSLDSGVQQTVDESIRQLSASVQGLNDLFRRRLVEDKNTKQLIQSVNTSLERRDAIERLRVFAPMIKELLLAVDRLQQNQSTPNLNVSVADEIITILSRYGLETIDTDGKVNPKIHEVVGIEPLVGTAEPNTIVKVERPGYMMSGVVLRPARVIVVASK